MASLPTAPLGKNGPQVPRMGLGCMGLSVFYGPRKPDEERLKLLDRAYELGERFWDTADMYGDSEELLGKWFAANPSKRASIFLATKFGGLVENSTPEYAREACAASLRRLGLPSVDLYYIHRLDRRTPIERTMRALVALKNEGKFKHIGISECSAASLRRAHAVHPVAAVQVEYSPFALDIESRAIDLLRTARELGVAVVAYSPLGRGVLAGTVRSRGDLAADDFRRFAPRFSEENFPRNLRLVDRVVELAGKKGVTPAQLVLAWLLAQGEDVFPIPGTTRIDRLEENLGALSVRLSEEEVREIREAVESAEVVGARYPEQYAAALFADTPPEEEGQE